MSRATRIIAVIIGTIAFIVAGLAYPIVMRGGAWPSAVWTVPVQLPASRYAEPSCDVSWSVPSAATA